MNECKSNETGMSRRDVLQVLAAATLLLPRPGWTTDGNSAADAAMAAVIGKRTVLHEGIKLTTPAIAENGNTVPIAVEVEGSFSADKYVKSIHVFALDNPTPDVISFHFSPASGKAKVGTRIRLAKTQRVVAIAEWSDDRVMQAANEVKVTIGGCGG